VHFLHDLDPSGTLGEDDDTVSEEQRLVHRVGHENRGVLLRGPDPLQFQVHLPARHRVESPEWLVEKAATSKLTPETASSDSPLRSLNSLLTSRSEMAGDAPAISLPASPAVEDTVSQWLLLGGVPRNRPGSVGVIPLPPPDTGSGLVVRIGS